MTHKTFHTFEIQNRSEFWSINRSSYKSWSPKNPLSLRCTWVIRRMFNKMHDLLTFRDNLGWPPVFEWVRIAYHRFQEETAKNNKINPNTTIIPLFSQFQNIASHCLGPLTKITLHTHLSVYFKSMSITFWSNPLHMCTHRKIPKCTKCQLESYQLTMDWIRTIVIVDISCWCSCRCKQEQDYK